MYRQICTAHWKNLEKVKMCTVVTVFGNKVKMCILLENIESKYIY